ncbi:MAG: hypothetical protein HY671_01285 [Chloroflexi bacterium]|nr:hypothetical protein [Chloroflexota bacterium]
MAAVLHLGVGIPLGYYVLNEPRIIPATIVEGLAALFLGVGAYAVFSRRTWAWRSVLAAHSFSIAGVILGMVSLAVGRGPRTELNDVYHRVMLAVLVMMLLFTFTQKAKVSLRHVQKQKQVTFSKHRPNGAMR